MLAAKPKTPPSAAATADLDAAFARVTPDLLRLLADGMPHPEAAITKALAERHDQQDIRHMLLRLAVTGGLVEHGGKFSLPQAEESAED
jgi:hypothetical protein